MVTLRVFDKLVFHKYPDLLHGAGIFLSKCRHVEWPSVRDGEGGYSKRIPENSSNTKHDI